MSDDTAAAIEGLFNRQPAGLDLCRRVIALVDEIGPADLRVTKSQVALRRKRGFAFIWRPGQYVKSDVPAVLSLASRQRIDSPRFKEVVQPSRSRWMHHLEIRVPGDLDDEVRGWLRLAYDDAS